MADRPRAAISWSGGKDSCAALARVVDRFDVIASLTMFDEAGARSRSHGLTPAIVRAQAARLGVSPLIATCTWETYNAAFASALATLAADGITHVVFGDIMFDEHRRWAETMCAGAGLTSVEPIWGEPTDAMLREFLERGGEAIIVTARTPMLDDSWLGRTLTSGMGEELARLGVDPCGERGEYHTLVIDTPLFDRPLRIRALGKVQRSGCWALDVALEPEEGTADAAGR